MPEIRLINPEENSAWDDFAYGHVFGWLCHLSPWKRVLEKSFSHISGRYPVIIKNSRIIAGLPFFYVKSRILGNRVVSIPYATLSDPLVDNISQLVALLKKIKEMTIVHRTNSIEIRSLKTADLFKDCQFQRLNFYKHHYLDLTQGIQKLYQKFHRTCIRQRIARANNSGLIIQFGQTEADLSKFYMVYALTRKRLGLPTHPYRFFKILWETLAPKGLVELMLVEKGNGTIAGLLALKFKDRFSVEYAASNDEYKAFSPNHFIFWEAIQSAHRQGFRVFDFGRTPPDNPSLMDFKRRWGTTELDLPQQYFPPRPEEEITQRSHSRKHRLIKMICQKSHPYVCRLVDNFLYSHLG
jgi:Acetyltransferase (GNAT) domain